MSADPGGTSARLRALYEEAGAQWLELPVLHPADPFLETAGEDIRRRMFVTEGRRGERLALRPDFTIPVCLEHLRSAAGAARYGYEGLVFRRHDTGAPERLETGYEDVGREDRVAADAETLALCVAAGAALTPGPFQVRLGDIGLFVALLTALGLPEAWRRRLRRSFGVPQLMDANLDRLSEPRGPDDTRLESALREAADRHDRASLIELLTDRFAAHGHTAGLGRTADEIAGRFLDQRELAEARIEPAALRAMRSFLAVGADLAAAPAALRRFSAESGVELGAALQRFEERAAAIARLSPPAAIRFEAGFGRPLDYYTGLVFELSAVRLPFPIAGGGRYDRLLQMLGGPAVPAVGFTIRLDLIGGERAP